MSFVFSFCSCGVSSKLATEEQMKHEYIYDVTEMNKDLIYDKIMKYIANNFKSAKSVIDYQDKQAGSIVAKGILPEVDYGGLVNGKLGFTLNVTVKDNKFKLFYSNLIPMTQDGTEMPSLSDRQDVHTIGKSKFDIMSKDILSYVNKKDDF